MKVLVTGGAGFIGSHLVRLLQAEGEQVAVVDNFTTGLRENLPEGTEIHECDVTSEALGNIFEAGHFDAVVHLAGQTTVHVSTRSSTARRMSSAPSMCSSRRGDTACSA